MNRVWTNQTSSDGRWHVSHDDVIKWKHFRRNRPFVREIHRSPINHPHKGQRHGVLMFSLICAWTNGWANNRDTGGLIHRRAHYNVTVMHYAQIQSLKGRFSPWLSGTPNLTKIIHKWWNGNKIGDEPRAETSNKIFFLALEKCISANIRWRKAIYDFGLETHHHHHCCHRYHHFQILWFHFH